MSDIIKVVEAHFLHKFNMGTAKAFVNRSEYFTRDDGQNDAAWEPEDFAICSVLQYGGAEFS
eukprot:1819873-Karenia_brevis.AAC.1